MADLSAVFHALSDRTRRDIVRRLRAGDRSAGELAAAFPLAKSTLSAHFGVLRRAGLVTSERRGTSVVYRSNPSALLEVVGAVTGWLDGAVEPPVGAPPGGHRAGRPAAIGPVVGGGVRTHVLRGGLLFLAAGLAGRPPTRGAPGGERPARRGETGGPELPARPAPVFGGLGATGTRRFHLAGGAARSPVGQRAEQGRR